MGAKAAYQNKAVSLARTSSDLTEMEVAREVSIAWGEAYCCERRYELYSQLDTVYQDFEKAARLRYETEATSRLEYLSAMNQSKQIAIQKEQARQDYHIALHKLNMSDCNETVKNYFRNAVVRIETAGYEKLMELSDDDDRAVIYMKRSGDRIQDFILYSVGDDPCMVDITGNFKMSDVQALIACAEDRVD
jgi:Outer membrane protein